MAAALTRTESWSLLALSFAAVSIIANSFENNGAPLVASLAFSALAFSMTYAFIRWSGPSFMKANLKGKDIGKAIPKEM